MAKFVACEEGRGRQRRLRIIPLSELLWVEPGYSAGVGSEGLVVRHHPRGQLSGFGFYGDPNLCRAIAGPVGQRWDELEGQMKRLRQKSKTTIDEGFLTLELLNPVRDLSPAQKRPGQSLKEATARWTPEQVKAAQKRAQEMTSKLREMLK